MYQVIPYALNWHYTWVSWKLDPDVAKASDVYGIKIYHEGRLRGWKPQNQASKMNIDIDNGDEVWIMEYTSVNNWMTDSVQLNVYETL